MSWGGINKNSRPYLSGHVGQALVVLELLSRGPYFRFVWRHGAMGGGFSFAGYKRASGPRTKYSNVEEREVEMRVAVIQKLHSERNLNCYAEGSYTSRLIRTWKSDLLSRKFWSLNSCLDLMFVPASSNRSLDWSRAVGACYSSILSQGSSTICLSFVVALL